ncbi:MAG: hypothetical protein ACRDUW_04995 [Pseudonocardiaceae bacterium]
MATSGGTPVGYAGATSSSANRAAAANAAAVATLAAKALLKTFLTQVVVTVGAAAAATDPAVTIAGVTGGTITVLLEGGTNSGESIVIQFNPPLPSSAVNTAIVVTVPASGAAGPAISALAVGFYQ